MTEDISDESFVIMGGDFNVTLNPELDKSGGKYYPQSKNVQKLNDLLKSCLIDIYRKFDILITGELSYNEIKAFYDCLNL